MSSINNYRLQEIFAKLITNPRFVIKAIESPVKFIEKFKMDDLTSKAFVDFFEVYGNNFISASFLLKKKRFQDIREALQVTNKIYTEEDLERYFDRYLTSLSYEGDVPKNPVKESIFFCKYMLNYEKISKTEKILFRYEISRNRVIIEKGEHLIGYGMLAENIIDSYVSEKHNLFFHPCMKIKKYKCNISSLIESALNLADLKKTAALYMESNETLLIYKNCIKGGIATIKLSESMKKGIQILLKEKNMKNSYEKLHRIMGICNEDFIRFVDALVKLGIAMYVYAQDYYNEKGGDYVQQA